MVAFSDLCNKIIPCYRLLLDKLIVAQLVRILLPTLEHEVSFYRVKFAYQFVPYLRCCRLSMCIIFPNLNEKTKRVCVYICLFWPELESSMRNLA